MPKISPFYTPNIAADLMKEYGTNPTRVFGKDSSFRSKLVSDLKNPDKNDRIYPAAVSHFINDRIGVDTMQVMPEFKHGDFIDTVNNIFREPTIDCPRRLATSNAIVNMTQDASLIGNVTAKYIPHKEEHKNSMLAATKHLSDAKTLNSNENSYEIMESNFKLHDELQKFTVNIENFDHQSRMEIEI